MQCPDCGYEADDASVFCPQCRFQFRETGDTPAVPETTVPDEPAPEATADESIDEDPREGFSVKELRLLDIQLIQPSVLVVLIISLFTYSVISTVPFIPITIAGLNFGITGIICLACGLVAGMVFFFLFRVSLARFRYR